MKAKAKKRSRGYLTILLFALAATLLIFSTVGSSRAALTYYSTTYGAQVELQDIGITLEENGKPVDTRNYLNNNEWDTDSVAGEQIPEARQKTLLTDMLKVKDENGDLTGEEETLKIGKAYPEVLTAYNSGNIPVYLRMTVYRYWVDINKETGEQTRNTTLSPELIELALAEDWQSSWICDKTAHTRERDVYYYKTILDVGQHTAALTKTLTITGLDGVQCTVTTTKEEVDGGTVYRTTYTYDGAAFVVEATVDAVQTHNAADAIKSAWGVDATFSGSAITAINGQG